jgi:hypothetical protein
VKIRLRGTPDECRQMAQLLIDTPGFEVVSVSKPYADRGASVLVRVFVEARLDRAPEHVVSTMYSGPRSDRTRAPVKTRRRTLPPGGTR